MTSHVLVMAAWDFVPPNSAKKNLDREDRGRRIPALICTAPLSRALVANVFVQTRKHMQHKVVYFFLHDKVIPAFRIPILFVYCVLMDCYNSTSQNPISTVQRISETMPHIQTLDIDNLPDNLGETSQLALTAALPKTLWSLCLKGVLYPSDRLCFKAGFVTQLAESCPFLQRLELYWLNSEACDELFSTEKNLFPNLRALSVRANADPSSELYNRVLTSQAVSSRRLESFGFCTKGPALAEDDEEPIPAPSLKPLECLHSLGLLFALSKLSTVPDFSVLNCCSDLTELLLEAAFIGNQQQQQIVVDLSTMPCLTSLGERTLLWCKGLHTLVLPPTLRTLGRAFCVGSSVEQIDFSLCADSLRFVDTEHFLRSVQGLETFSTLPLLGKIGTVVGGSFMSYCSTLRRVDLGGLQGIVEIKDDFLGSTAVEELDLSALGPTCTKVGDYFLGGCRSLKKVTGCDGLAAITSVGSYFLWCTENLEEFDFAAMQALSKLGGDSLSNSALEEEGTKVLNGVVQRNRRQQNEQQQSGARRSQRKNES